MFNRLKAIKHNASPAVLYAVRLIKFNSVANLLIFVDPVYLLTNQKYREYYLYTYSYRDYPNVNRTAVISLVYPNVE